MCTEKLEFIKPGPREDFGSGGTDIVVPLDSDIYRCPMHGLFRIYISGAYKPYVERS